MIDRRLILLATPRQIGVLDWRPGRMHWLGEFPASSKGLAAFRQLVISHAGLPMLLVVDTVDEDYRSELLPHVQGHARNELLARKLRQVFRNARFTGTWRQVRETDGRRDDRYLLAALTDTDWLSPWLDVLLLDPSGQLDCAQAPLDADPAFSTRLVETSDLARALRIPADFLAATPEVAPLAAIASQAVPLNLAPPELLQRCLLYTSPSPRDKRQSRMPSSA